MKKFSDNKYKRGQSMVEMAVTLPILFILLMGMVEIVIAGRTFLALLEASVAGSRLGSKGEYYYDDSEILTLTTQALSKEGYVTSNLIDVIIVRADLVDGTEVNNYRVANMLGSGRSTGLTKQYLENRMNNGDPTLGVVGVEVVYDYNLLFGSFKMLPDPIFLRAYSFQPVHPQSQSD